RRAGHPDHVAEVEEPVDLEGLVAEPIPPRVDLEPAGAVLDLQKTRFPEVAQRHDAAADGDRTRGRERVRREGRETGMHLTRRMIRAEIVRVRVDPPLPKRLQLFPPDHDLLVVFGHETDVSRDARVYW